jgi:glycosyltransferase involved in cell wall biosynthesis
VKIAYIDHTSDMGGAEHNLLNLVTTLAGMSVLPTVLTTPGGPLVERLQAKNIPVRLFSLSESTKFVAREQLGMGLLRTAFNRLPELWNVQSQLRRLLADLKPDMVQTNSLKAHVLGSLAVAGTGMPMIWHLQDLPTQRGNSLPLLEICAALVKPRIVCISKAVMADLSPKLQQYACVIYNGIDSEAVRQRAKIHGQSIRTDFGIPAEAPLIGVVAHLIPWKGHRHLLAAISQLQSKFPNLYCLCVGGEILQFAGQKAALQAESQRLGVANRVFFTGQRDDVAEIMNALDFLVVPSEHEPFGLVLVEAMALGKPVVATRSGGIPEIVREGETGLMVPVADSTALAEKIAYYLDYPDRARRAGEAGDRRVESCFTLTTMAEKFATLYGEICG